MRVSDGAVGEGAKEHRAMAREGVLRELGFGRVRISRAEI